MAVSFWCHRTKNFIITFCCNASRGLKEQQTSAPLLGSVFRLWRSLFSQSQVISESVCSRWLLYALLPSNRWRCHKLIGCWNKQSALCPETGLWRLDKLSCWRHWDGPLYTDAAFPAAISSGRKSLMHAGLKSEKKLARAKTGRGGCSGIDFRRSLMLQLAWFPHVAYLSFKLLSCCAVFICQVCSSSHLLTWCSLAEP